MKWLAIILVTIQLSSLLGVSCSDANNVCAEFKSTSKELKHIHSQDRDDYCAPFCLCNCCGVSMAFFKFNSPDLQSPLQEFKVEKVVVRDSLFVSNHSGNIWQPPRFNA